MKKTKIEDIVSSPSTPVVTGITNGSFVSTNDINKNFSSITTNKPIKRKLPKNN